MEFNATYRNTMDTFAIGGNLSSLSYFNSSARDVDAYKGIIKATVTPNECIIPSVLAYVSGVVSLNPNAEPKDIAVPLYRLPNIRTCSGADTLFKYICRWCNARLTSFRVKDEIYYGCRGILLDKNFNPLVLSTVHLKLDEPNVSMPSMSTVEYIIHVHPSVFTEETTVNKAITRKGIPYYLANPLNSWGSSSIPFRVVIDDSSEFYVKPSKPDFRNFSSDQINNFLKEHIDEVLQQVADDCN